MDEEYFEEVTRDEEFSDEKVKETVPVIYCGPDKPKLGLKKHSVFVGGLTPVYTDAIATAPEIMKLIVPYPELESMRAKIAKSGTPEHEYYARIAAL